MSIGLKTVEKIIHYWWETCGKNLVQNLSQTGYQFVQEEIEKLRETTGEILRMDHTYDFVKPLAGYDSKTKRNVRFCCCV